MRGALLVLLFGMCGVPMGRAGAEIPRIYGQLRFSADGYELADEWHARAVGHSIWLGARATQPISEHTALVLQLEEEFWLQDDVPHRSTRDTFIGVASKIGLFRVGYMEGPLRDVSVPADFFAGQLGDIRNFSRLHSEDSGANFDRRLPSSVRFVSPLLHGFAVDALYSADTSSENRPAETAQTLWTAAVSWRNDRWYVGVGHQHEDTDSPQATRLVVRWSGQTWDASAFVQSASLSYDRNAAVVGGGARRRIGNLFLKAQCYQFSSTRTESDARLWALGADWLVMPDVRIHLIYASAESDRMGEFGVTYASTLRVQIPRGVDARALSLGLRYVF